MKLRALNKFKRKKVQGIYKTKTGELIKFKGIVEDVEEDNITIQEENGLKRIYIKELYKIHLIST